MYINKRHICYFFIVYTCLFAIAIAPSIIHPLSTVDSQTIMEHNNAVSQSATVASIFNNNLYASCLTLIPYVGWGWAVAVLWQTGVVVSSYGQPWYFLLTNPFAYIELAVFSYVILRSVKLLQLFKQRKTKFTDLDGKTVIRKTTGAYPEIAKTIAYTLIVCTITLLASAFIEYMVIRGVL